MAGKQARRQTIRKALIIVSFLLFPLTINFFSPYIIIDGASQGIVNGSLLVFGALFVSALLLGRAWCGWVCPAAGLQEACFLVRDKPARGGKLDWIKWGIWMPWIGIIAFAAVSAGGYRTVDPFHLMDASTSAADYWGRYVIYYIVVGTIAILALTSGRRGFCHYGCWMAPFMIIGRKLRNLARWPSLRLQADAAKCNDCQRCTQNCPMSLDVNGMVRQEKMEHSECILCGTCVDVCPKDVIRYAFGR